MSQSAIYIWFVSAKHKILQGPGIDELLTPWVIFLCVNSKSIHQSKQKPITWSDIFCWLIVFSWIFKKRHSGYSGYSNNTQYQDIGRIFKIPNTFFTEIRSLEIKFVVKKLLKNLLFSNCDLWSFPNRYSRKQQNLSYLSSK